MNRNIAYEVSLNNSKKLSALRRKNETDLKRFLNERADYVDLIAKGDASILLSSEYNLAKTTRMHHILPMTTDVSIKAKDDKGALYLK